jgi:hypothetical protein
MTKLKVWKCDHPYFLSLNDANSNISGRLIISQIIVGSTKDSDHLFAISPCPRRTSRSNSIKQAQIIYGDVVKQNKLRIHELNYLQEENKSQGTFRIECDI